ncbi:MAG TPA: tetratricopeptide repeat protein [Burkholderiales bacterium]|nr:tetratricopeptide repeat protein [Burkholderiales bacterium]
MSLLLEALKKAEKAKEEAQRRAKGAAAGVDPQPSAFDPEATVLDENRHVTTRNELPDISAPLEILSEDLRSGSQAKSPPLQLAIAEDPAPAPAPEPKAPPRRESARAAAEPQGAAASAAAGAERATAQRVFEAKFKEPNPRLPFYITVAVLGLFALGTVVYFWIQLRPAPSLVNPNPVRSADEKVVAPVAAPAAAPAATAPGSAPASAIPGLPDAPASQPSAATPAPATLAPARPAAEAPAAAPPVAVRPAAPAARDVPAARRKPAVAGGDDDPALSVNRGKPQIHPQVSSGYAAFLAGDLAKARDDYQQALRDEPGNRDALLGLAAVEMRAQRYDLADGYYRRVLQADPRDPHAQAGMLALRSEQLDPVQVESRVKTLIASDRDANVLYFTLGNQYAKQGRWAEAQQAYFKAFATDPDNPDFAFNVAVSLDQLRQPKLALEYYRRALALAEKRSANFSADAVRERVQQLSR